MMNHRAEVRRTEAFVVACVQDEGVPHLVDEHLTGKDEDGAPRREPQDHEHVLEKRLDFTTRQTIPLGELREDAAVAITKHPRERR